MAKKKGKKVTKKVSLKQLLGRGESNVDLHKDDPKKRKYHVRHRTPRNRLMHLRGDEYTRPLSNDPATDMKYHELAREFVNNGLDGAKAYAAVYGVSLKNATTPATKIFNSSWMKSKIREYMLGADGEFRKQDLPEEYLIVRLMQMIENNILDYFDDDGKFLSVKELRALPDWAQQQIKRLNVRTETLPVAIRMANGEIVRDADGNAETRDVVLQHVTIELFDKQKAMEQLAKVMDWISTNIDLNVRFIGAETMQQAEARVKKLRRQDIEGEAKRVAAD